MRSVLRIVLPLIVLALGAVAMAGLIGSRKAPSKKARQEQGALVEYVVTAQSLQRSSFTAQGSVVPSRQVVLQAEVAGRIVWQAPELVPGGRLERGQLALRIDERDYALALEQQAAEVERAQLEVRVESSRRQVAQREWEILGEDEGATEEGRLLALREPQLETARANLHAAQSARRVAERQISKTKIHVPFNAFVQSESAEVGQLVAPQTPLATLIGTDSAWVQVSLPMERLGDFCVPGFNCAAGEGSVARVSQDIGGERVEREGRVIRLLGDLDPVGRLARVLVEVEDPLGLRLDESQPPLLIGAYVQVDLQGAEEKAVVAVPPRALREGDQVFLVGKDSQLEMRHVSVAWQGRESVWIDSGLQAGEKVIVSRLPVPISGMALRARPRQAPRADTEEKAVQAAGARLQPATGAPEEGRPRTELAKEAR